MKHIGFNASYGEFPLKKLNSKHFPAIAFFSNGEAILISGINEDGRYLVCRFNNAYESLEENYDFLSLKQQIKPYDVIDTRQGKLTFTDDTSIEAMSVRLVDLGLATIEEVIAEVKLVEPNPTPTKQEVQPTSTAKTK